MTRTSDTFGALALAILTVFALWSSTLTTPAVDDPVSVQTTAVSSPVA